MNVSTSRGLLAGCLAAGLVFSLTATASAQYRPIMSSGSSTDTKGEKYHIELAGNLWNPAPDFMFQSEGLGIDGSEIDLDQDLGIEQKRLKEGRLVLRPARKHKLRVHYLPMTYEGDAVINKDIVFNGIKYPVNAQVTTAFKWTAYRFTYEYDVYYRPRGFVGLLFESKYADTSLELDSLIGSEYVKARAPIPAIGLVARVYPLSFVSVHGEFTYFRLPDSVKDAKFRAVDFDVYGTVNIGHNFGVQGGFRSIDMSFALDQDAGAIKLTGPYVGGVVRF